MKTLLFFMSFLIILLFNRPANAVITCALQYPTPSGLSGWSIPDSRFSLFEYFHRMPHGGASNFDFYASAIFGQTKTISDLIGMEDLDAQVILADGSDNIVSEHFLNSGGYSKNPQPIGISWSSADMIACLNTDYAIKENSSDLTLFVSSDSQSGIRDFGNDVIDVVPLPGAFILGGVGLGMIGWLRRNRTL